MILIIMLLVLLLAGLLSWVAGRWNRSVVKWIALCSLLINLVIISGIFIQNQGTDLAGPVLDTTAGAANFMIEYKLQWIAAFGISFHLAMDGLSAVMLFLCFFLGTVAVLCSWNEITKRTGFYYFNLLWTLAGITGVFIALDLFLFYFFWEVMLVPMYFLIAIWGDTNRKYAAYKFFIYTQAGGLMMLLAILALYFIHGTQTGVFSFDFPMLLQTDTDGSTARWIMMGFLFAFLVKLPVVPLHNWLPDAHSEAPTAGSLILAGLLLKTGAYGIIRFILPLFPQTSEELSTLLMLFGVAGIIYGAVMAFAQTDIKRLIAYTSVSHMGFVVLGIFSFREIAMQGVIIQMITHGISTGALFLIAGMLKERLHTRDIQMMGGLWTAMPGMGGVTLVFVMASLGLPMLGNFIGEFLVLLGSFPANSTLTILATLGFVFSALYSLRLMQRIFYGPINITSTVDDLKPREIFMMSVLIISIILLGMYPQPVIDMVEPVVKDVLKEHGNVVLK